MRIAQLNLKAFGHFTDRRLTFNAGCDFHIVYGPNEAGKTTISRSLKAALFGVPERTSDNHLHANANLRVGVVLEANGKQLAAMRRKARKNSLIQYDPLTGEELNDAIPDEVLTEWMGGLTDGLYTSMFGLDHDELVAGGRALSEGKGELGQSLFEAGAGLSSVRQLRDKLLKEADTLFRPRASSSTIHKVLEQYSDARKEARLAQTRPAEWEVLRKAAVDAKIAYESVRSQQGMLQKEVLRLERLKTVLPDIATRSLALDSLTLLGEVTKLSPDASALRMASEAALHQAEKAADGARSNIERLQSERDGIEIPSTIMSESGSIESLYFTLDAFRSARELASSATGRLSQSGTRIALILSGIGEPSQDDLRQMIPSATLRARVQGLLTRGATLQAERNAATAQVIATKKELEELNSDLADLGLQNVPAALIEMIEHFETEGNPAYKADELLRQVASLEVDLQKEAAVLAGSDMEMLAAMAIPLAAELQNFRADREKIETRKEVLRNKIESLENDIAARKGEIEGLKLQGELPTAEHLALQRGLRDSLWQRIRSKVFPTSTIQADEPLPSPQEYEFAVQSADSIADSRFSDVSRVTQYADLMKRLAQMRNVIDLERSRFKETLREADGLRVRWQLLLEKYGLPALEVNEMQDWLNKRALFMQRYQTFKEARNKASLTSERAVQMKSGLSAALVEAGLPGCAENESLAQAFMRARAIKDQASKADANHKLLAKKKKSSESNLEKAKLKVEESRLQQEAWQFKWGEAMAEIRLTPDALPEEATARLGQFEQLGDALDKRDGANNDLDLAASTLDRVEQEAARLCAVTHYERANRSADAVVETLYEQLCAGKELAQRFKSLVEKIKEAEKAQDQANQSIQVANQNIATLMSVAGVATLSELMEAESRSAEALKLESNLKEVEKRLVAASALPLQELLAQATGQDLTLVKADLQRAIDDSEACHPLVEEKHAKLIAAESALNQVEGDAKAAEAEQRAAEAVARLSNLIADYASARLSSAIISEVIETYQQRYQGPLLARASELFATITHGRFGKIATDFAEDMTILVGVRANGKRETVANLSSGTRDQLFLALRLAAIESHVTHQQPMPVVVDDIVINFDDASASATFKVLAELSQKTQVLFFTHHEHLLERAANAIGTESFVAHKL